MTDTLITIGVITHAHGIKGAVKVKSFTQNPDDIFAYTPTYDTHGQPLHIAKIGVAKGLYMAQVTGCHTRTDADRLKGTEICVRRSQLPSLEDNTYYHTDLLQCTVLNACDTPIGTVKGLHNYGAGDLIEVLFTDTQHTELFLFTTAVGNIDLQKKTVVLHIPDAVSANHTQPTRTP